ncbi:E3 ubiquitin-protein ligase TRIM56-like [Amphiura filiformis]|uniref:E3 ubiquitin-protein ligase TRIM56-like n=1 Tax=Amphiura filiformis TaxID=82378 RepID=UPI003B20BA25
MAAAHELIQNLDQDLLECGICLYRYNQPRALPCLHCFCHECLQNYCEAKKQILCPNCREPTAVPKEGVSGFPAHSIANTLQETLDMEKLKVGEATAYTQCYNCNLPDKKAVVRCLDCEEFFCQTCHTYHDSFKAMQDHNIVSIDAFQPECTVQPSAKKGDRKCKDHEGESKKFYCETCKKPVCRDCIVMKQHCRDHDYVTMKEASKEQAARLVQLAKEAEDLKKKYQDAIEETEAIEGRLTTSSKNAEKRVDDIKNQHLQMVTAVYDKYKAELRKKKDNNSVKIRQSKKELETSKAKVENTCALANKITQMGSDYDIASLYPTLSASLEELNEMTKPETADDILIYVSVEEIRKLKVPDVVSVLRHARWTSEYAKGTQRIPADSPESAVGGSRFQTPEPEESIDFVPFDQGVFAYMKKMFGSQIKDVEKQFNVKITTEDTDVNETATLKITPVGTASEEIIRGANEAIVDLYSSVFRQLNHRVVELEGSSGVKY